ncbi:MAG: YdcF family protein [Clostridia bacterium]|nr:YdcF family protein [Clostridia bacterium]
MNGALKAAAGVIGGSAAFLVTTAAAYMPFVAYDANMNYRDDCDYLLILGGDIIGADTPSPQLFERMKSAAVYLNEHTDVIAVPCGGCFREHQKKSEVAIIADYLIKEGVEPDRILLEDNSTTTFENFKFGIPIIEKHAGKSADELRIAFLSSSYHMHRAGIIARRSGIKNVLRVSAPTPGEAFKRYVREYFVAYELLYRNVPNPFKRNK